MAARESQGLQVALILFVMVTVVLAVTTYLYFRRAEENVGRYLAKAEEAKREKETTMKLQFENQVLKHILGYDRKTEAELTSIKQGLGGNEQMKQIMDNYDKHMKMYGAGYAGQDLSYTTLPEHLIVAINARNKNLVDADTMAKDLERQREQIKAAEAARAKKAEEMLATVQTDLASEREKFNAERTRITEEGQKVAAIVPQKNQELAKVTAAHAATKEEMTRSLTQLNQLYESQREQLEKMKKDAGVTYERPDGEVTLVNSRANTVWINLGSADNVERQMIFSVIDQNETGVTRSKVKGRIEITQVKDRHTSEARILDEEDLANPIMQGDKIYSPSFRKGQKTRFALAGLIDMDKDGKSDQTKVKALITMNGGLVDAELLEDGSIAGKITMETRYLVKGDRPTDKTNQKLIEGYTAMTGEATRLGIESITLENLLDRMGYVPDNRVVPMSRPSAIGDAKSEAPRPKASPTASP
ncbi:MAG: hypothetical protein GX575_05725 [Candidatus Anammoximicrobium sp.]|nr:hypothetical protein [Candidatus Anammoximicrobium sp.]